MLNTLFLALALLAPTSTSLQGTPPKPAAPAAQELDIAEEIFPAIQWLRTTQDPVDGSYGKSVEATALALAAFSEHAEHYRVADGPFVKKAMEWLIARQRADGLICDEKAGGDACKQQTILAVHALTLLRDPSCAAPLAKAMAALAGAPVDPDAMPVKLSKWPMTAEEAGGEARRLLAARKERDRWDGPRGAIAETAAHAIALSRLDALIKKAAAPAPAPKPIEKLPAFSTADRAATLKAIEKGCDYLANVSDGGKWGAPGKPDAGFTALAIAALQSRPAPRPAAQQKLIDDGLAWLASLQKSNGAIHDGKLANYQTSGSILAFVRSGDPKWKPVIEKARAFLITLQFDEGEGYSEGDLYYGGVGYDTDDRPDLTNLQMALEALAASGLEPNAPTYKKALKFLERCQNRSESNDVAIHDGEATTKSGDDGGGVYQPGNSKAGFVELSNGVKVPRSYGSMTYALLKCFVFAGLPKDDPRLAAAIAWCSKNYTLDVNPGFDSAGNPAAPYQGLFYYLHTMAQALGALGVDSVTDSAGAAHPWRQELCGRMVSMQSKVDGSWINHNSPRWYEGNPVLGTAYGLLTLDAAMPRAQ